MLSVFTIGGFLELLKISIIFVIMLFVTMRVDKFVCSIGTEILFYASVILGFRLLIPFHLPMTLEIICPFLTTSALNVFSNSIYGSVRIYHLLLFVWFTVAVIKIISIYIEYKKFTCLLWSLSKIQNNRAINPVFKKTLTEFDLKANVTVVVSDKIKHPFVIGFREVFIALPLKSYTAPQLRHILIHELNHVKSHDFEWKAFFEVLSALYWWYPIMHIFKKQFFKLLEIRNDMRCIDGMPEKEQCSYLSCILDESESFETYNRFVLPFSMLNKSFLRQRFILILNNEVKKNFKIQVFIMLILVVLFILSISISLAPISL